MHRGTTAELMILLIVLLPKPQQQASDDQNSGRDIVGVGGITNEHHCCPRDKKRNGRPFSFTMCSRFIALTITFHVYLSNSTLRQKHRIFDRHRMTQAPLSDTGDIVSSMVDC
jgi:hypothetical protein